MSAPLYGIVSAVDHATCRVRVRLPERDNVQTWWLHVPQTHTLGVQRRALLPAIGEQVMVLLEADDAGGTVHGGIYSEANPPPIQDADTEYVRFKDGTRVTYNQSTHALMIDGPASVTVIAGQATVQADVVTLDTPQTTCTGNLTVQGQVSITGNVKVDGDLTATGSVMDGGGNSNHHSH